MREAVLSDFPPRKLEEPPFETCAETQHGRQKDPQIEDFIEAKNSSRKAASDDNHDDAAETVDGGPISTSSQGYSMEFPLPDTQSAS